MRPMRCSRDCGRLGWIALLVIATCGAPGYGQTLQDGIMLSRGTLCTGVLYTHDS